MNSNTLQNKKGILGSFVVMFVATIVIVIILTVFILSAGVIKKLNGAEGGTAIYDEEGVEIDNVFDYMDRYISLVKVRFFLERGSTLEKSFAEGDYGK